jgi:hypothetical protein
VKEPAGAMDGGGVYIAHVQKEGCHRGPEGLQCSKGGQEHGIPPGRSRQIVDTF